MNANRSNLESSISPNASNLGLADTNQASLDLLHNSSPGILESFGTAFVYSGVQEPYQGVRELVNRVVSKNILPEVHIVDRPPEMKFGSVAWHAQAIGSGMGMLAPLALLKGSVGRGAGTLSLAAEGLPLAGRAGRIAALKTPILESLAMGAAYEGLLKPVGDVDNFWQQRAINGAIGGATFGAMHKASHLMGDFAVNPGKSVAEKAIAGARNGIFAGAMGGAVNHEAHAIAEGKISFDAQGLAKNVYSFAVPGMAMGGMHAARTQRSRIGFSELLEGRERTEVQEIAKREPGRSVSPEELARFLERQFPNLARGRELEGRSQSRQLTAEEKKTLDLRPDDSVQAIDFVGKDGKPWSVYY